MKELLEKISSYHILNHLLPGVIFIVAINAFTIYNIPLGDDLITGAFVAYFFGLLISRFGSLIIEPILKKIKFITYAPYADYVKAVQKDQKISDLLETNNMFRTLSAMTVLFAILKIVERVELTYQSLRGWNISILVVVIMIFFFVAYRKQTKYIKKRVETINAG